uniref:Reverse transcriptase domain-containing protein n=1 Tax=Cannabis sativa TaxID=3483 RepID=A0A803NL84_CANSA
MDDLTSSLSVALNLTETECTIQTLHDHTPANTPETEPQHTPPFLVVKVLTVKSYNRKNFIEKMTKNWNHISRNPVIITERPHGLFLVEFGCDGDRRRVLLQQPWTYLNQAILMDIPNSLDVLNGDSLLKIPLWVQVFNTPFLKRSEELAALVSSSLGHMLELYKPSLRETWGPYFRLRVMFDVAQPSSGLPIHFSYNKGCMDYMKACDEAPFPPELRYDIKTITGKVKVSTNAMLCHEQLNFANPPVAPFMTSNPASAVCVAPPEIMPPFPTYGSQDINPSHGQTQQVGLFKSGPSTLPQNFPQWNQPDPTNNAPTHNHPQNTLETITPTYTALMNATMSNSSVQKASPTSTPNQVVTSQHSSGSNSTSQKHCHVPLPENIPLLDTSKRLEAMNLTYQPGFATPSGSKASRKRNKPDSKDKFKRQTEVVNGELRLPATMKLVSWNARGLGSDRAFRNLSRLVSFCNPTILFIMESRLAKNVVDNLKHKLHFDSGLEIPRIGRSGGLLLFWSNDVTITLLSQSISHFDCYVSCTVSNAFFHLTCFYGSPIDSLKAHTWNILNRIGRDNSRDPWLIIGDFNAFLFSQDKQGGNPDRGPSSDFRQLLDSFNLSPLDPSGPLLTWNNNVASPRNIQERLDWGIVNNPWTDNFPDATLAHLGFYGSDHRALELVTSNPSGARPKIKNKRFHFENVWLQDPNWNHVLDQSWTRLPNQNEPIHNLVATQNACAQHLNNWNHKKDFNFKKHISELEKHLEIARSAHIWDDNTIRNIKELQSRLDSLLYKEETYWKQRARTQWLAQGDKNTKFFHRYASHRKKTNKIHQLHLANGGVVSDEESIIREMESHFHHLFTSSNPSAEAVAKALEGIEISLSEIDKSFLAEDFSLEEIEKAFFQLPPDKAPGPDGFNSNFYKANWSSVKNDVLKAAADFLNENGDITPLNTTLITLIPKVKQPTTLSEYRPISLCNTIYKVISKTIANRLKLVLNNLISPNQSAFLPDRLISDNIIIAQEVAHSIKLKTRGKKGWMAVKLDMAKAFDRVEWTFIDAILRKFQFPAHFAHLVLSCISTASFKFNLNGRILGNVSPSRVARRAPAISHLLFADDSFLFCQASINSCNAIKEFNGAFSFFVWRSICLGKELFQGSYLKIGNGRTHALFRIIDSLGFVKFLLNPRLLEGRDLSSPFYVLGYLSPSKLFPSPHNPSYPSIPFPHPPVIYLIWEPSNSRVYTARSKLLS